MQARRAQEGSKIVSSTAEYGTDLREIYVACHAAVEKRQLPA